MIEVECIIESELKLHKVENIHFIAVDLESMLAGNNDMSSFD